MRIYLSGVGGAGIGPLALLAKDLGHEVFGSDVQENSQTKQLEKAGISINYIQDGTELEKLHKKSPIEWFIHTPALSADHPELAFAAGAGIKTSKSGEFINQILEEKNLRLIAISGTHGKTTTTAMMIWLFDRFKFPVSYVVGTDLSWGPNAQFKGESEYLIFEADEYDKKFLDFKPYSAIISAVDYDHPDTYPTVEEYKDAFIDFVASSHCAYLWRDDAVYLNIDGSMPHCAHTYGAEENLNEYKLVGEHNRHNAFLVAQAFKELYPEIPYIEVVKHLNNFPGSKRRFEQLSDNKYTDYAHHPREIESTIEMAHELGKTVVVVYQPHQNVRQHQIIKDGGYKDAFAEADKVFWLPTYLTREDPDQPVLGPKRLVATVSNYKDVEIIEDIDVLIKPITEISKKAIVVFMGAVDIDDWARANFK